MPARILSDDELLNYIPYAPEMVRQYEIEHATDLGHATIFVRLESLELKGSICSVKTENQRFYYRPNQNKKESEVVETSPKGKKYVTSKNDSRL